MSGVNKVMLVGHVGKDPDLRYLKDHVAVTSFELVTAEKVIINGSKSEHFEWHHVVMWRTIAEQAVLKIKKGKLVCVEGRLHTRSFEDKLGAKKQITEIVAQNFRILGRNSDFQKLPWPDGLMKSEPGKHRIADAELCQLIRAGEKKGAEMLYDTFGSFLLLSIMHIVQDRKIAEQVLLAAIEKIWLSVNDYQRENERIYTWMMRLARNLSQEALLKIRNMKHEEKPRIL